MARALRLHFSQANYHVSSRVSTQHRALFRKPQDREVFLKIMAEAVRMFEIKIFAYYLSNHEYHLVISTPHSNLARAMRHMNSVYSQYYNRTYKKTGQLFGGRYRAILIDADKYLLDIVKFVHHGCTDKILDTDPDAIVSSAYYAFHNELIPEWLSIHEVLIWLCPEYGGSIPVAYDAFRRGAVSPQIVNFYKNDRHGIVLGTPEFLGELSRQLKDPVSRQTLLWNSAKHRTLMDAQRVIERLKAFYGIGDSELYYSKRRVSNEYRKAAVYLLRLWGYTYIRIMKILRYNTCVAVSYIYRVFSMEINNSPDLAREIQNLKEFIEQN